MSFWTRTLIDELRANADGPIDETTNIFHLDVRISSSEAWEKLRQSRDEGQTRRISLTIIDRDDGDGFDLLDEGYDPEIAGRTRVRIVKAAVPQTLRFFSYEGFRSALQHEPERFEDSLAVLLAELDEVKSTLGLVFYPWTDDVPAVPSPVASVSPRRLTNDITGTGIVPKNAITWLANEPVDTWNVQELAQVASRRLALCIPSELARDSDNNIRASVRGGRKVGVLVPSSADDVWRREALFNSLNTAGIWIFSEGKEAETKHALLIAELARIWPTNANWASGLGDSLPGALEAARTAYRLHLHERGVDALKLMSDLRNGLAADVRAVAGQTAALSAGLWRDAAIAFGATALRVILGGTSSWLPVIAGAYLVISCYLNCRVASRAVNSISENEKVFRERLYRPLLLEREYEDLAGSRYTKIITEFRCYRGLVICAYTVAVIALLILGLGYGHIGGEGAAPATTAGGENDAASTPASE